MQVRLSRLKRLHCATCEQRRTGLGRILGVAATIFILAPPPVAGAEINDTNILIRKILAIELEMQKVNCHLHLEAANPSFNRARRTWLWDIGNAVATESGLVSASALFFAHDEDKNVLEKSTVSENGKIHLKVEKKHEHNRANGAAVAGTLYPQIVGQAIGGSGALFELGADCSKLRKLKKLGLNESAIIAKMVAMNNESDRLIAQLGGSSEDVALLSEARILRDIKNETLCEFMRLEGQSGNMFAGQFIEDGVSFVRNSVGLVGNSINADAVLHNDRILNGDGTILNLVAASLITIRPFLSNTGSYLVKRVKKRKTAKCFPQLDPQGLAKLQADYFEWKKQPLSAASSARSAIYQEQIEKFEEERSLAEFEAKKSKQTSIRRYRESLYGPTKQTQAVIGLVIGFEHGNNATRDNRLAAAGNTNYMSGQFFNILELVRERAVDENAHSKAFRENMLPEQRIQKQLERIDIIQSHVLQNISPE